MKTSVSARLLDDSNTAVSASEVGDALNAAMKFWKVKRFWFNEFKEDVTLTADDPVITLPATYDLLIPFQEGGLSVTENERKYFVTKVRSEEYDADDVGGTGRPYIYTFRANAYEAYFIPDQAYTATWHGLRDYDDFNADADYNDFSVLADKLLVYEACKRLHAELRLDLEMADRYEAKVKQEYGMLLDRTNELNATGSIQIENI